MNKRVFVADFETTVYEGQTDTRVWSAAMVELNTEDVTIDHSIEDFFKRVYSIKQNILIYFHNLKFDGSFILDYLLNDPNMTQALDVVNDKEQHFRKPNEIRNNEYRYTISNMGQFYSILIGKGGHTYEIRDSLKLLPFSVAEIGKGFKTKHQKLEMEYTGFRYPGCEITDEEKEYIKNDVLVVKEALEIMYQEGHTKLTIGACCLSEFVKIYGKEDYKHLFPDMTTVALDEELYGSDNADDYIRKSYKGGWCYVVKGKEAQVKHNGFTADVNSLYPSVMSSESGCRYPVGEPHFWSGKTIPEECNRPDVYYFVRLRCRFRIKPGYLPFIQMKGTWLYRANECLETSDVYNRKTGKYHTKIRYANDEITRPYVTLTLTQTDWELFQEHYNIYDLEILDGVWFNSEIGIFDEYINRYKKMKMESKGARRQLAKLFLNNLYGKMASSKDSSFKVAILQDGVVKFYDVHEQEKNPGFIPVGSAITSYARNFTIRAAQKNYYGKDKPGFIYADTDSIHCDLPPEHAKGITVHPTNFCCWKLEAYWDEAIFVRQKTYIEHVTHEDGEPVDRPYYSVKCAGMPKRCKNYLIVSFGRKRAKYNYTGKITKQITRYMTEVEQFTHTRRKITDFKIGLCVPGKLLPKRLPGGIVLKDTTFIMREIL